MESKIYLTQHLMATRTGEDAGKVLCSVAQIARVVGHKWDHVHRALNGLEEKDYIKTITGGWVILNFNGDNPAKILRDLPRKGGTTPKRGTPKRGKDYPEKGELAKIDYPEKGERLPRNGVTRARKRKKTKPVNTPLDVDVKNKKDVNGAGASAPADWPAWYPGITWNKKELKVEMTEEAMESLSEHLRELAEQENLPTLKRREGQRSWGRLNGYLMRHRQVTGPKSLPPIVVNWFENDLRDPNRTRGSTSKSTRTDEIFDEAIRKAEEEEHAKRITE